MALSHCVFNVSVGFGRGWHHDPHWAYYRAHHHHDRHWAHGIGEVYAGRFGGTVPRIQNEMS